MTDIQNEYRGRWWRQSNRIEMRWNAKGKEEKRTKRIKKGDWEREEENMQSTLVLSAGAR